MNDKRLLSGVDEFTIEAGVFLVDKPVGPTSFRIVQQVRRALKIKKTGHAGTLDPFASGLLIICVGRPATRLVDQLMAGEKEYEATLSLGIETTTQDLEGEVLARKPLVGITPELVKRCLAGFVGEQMQTPPLYSALKHKGKPLYYYARKGLDVERQPRRIEISSIELLGLQEEKLKIKVCCGKGTYIRTLAADIGQALRCGAHLVALRRLRSGPFSVAEALDGASLAEPEPARKTLLGGVLGVEDVLAKL